MEGTKLPDKYKLLVTLAALFGLSALIQTMIDSFLLGLLTFLPVGFLLVMFLVWWDRLN